MRELYSYNQLCNSTVDFSPVTGASSESSSPRSSTTDDDLLEIHRSSEAGACNTAKPIYNFSIPDFIKHERQPVSAAIETSIADEPVIVSTRPRDVKRRNDFREAADNTETRDRTNDGNENLSNCHRRKKRRLCQRNPSFSPEFIDLTDGNDLDESSSVSEINHNPYLDSSLTGVTETNRDFAGNLQHSQSAVSFDSVAENLQRFRRRLRESRDRISQIRREVTARESRWRNRLSHRINIPIGNDNIVSDGPVYTSQNDLLMTSLDQSSRSLDHLDYETAETSVITVDDDAVDPSTPSNDGDITARMLDDPFYSPPFLTPLNIGRIASSRPGLLEPIDESPDVIHQRRRDRAISFERIRQQTQERIYEVRDRISRIDQRITGDRFQIQITDSPQEIGQSEDEVEFLRELRPGNPPTTRNFRALRTDVDTNNQLGVEWGHLSRTRRRLSSLLSHPSANVPDFLFPYVQLFSPAAAPRLHHFPSSTLSDAEDYEALWNLAERLGPAKPRGLTKTEIDRIHAFRFTAACAEETNSNCVVCMSDYCLREKIRKLPCTHDFHSKCIDKWLKSNKTCPVCRDEIKCI